MLVSVLCCCICAPIFAQWKQPKTQDSTRISSEPLGTTTPGEYPFTPEQDRRFYQALSEYVSGIARFRYDVCESSTMRINEALYGTLDASVSYRNMNFSYDMFTPNAREHEIFVQDRLAAFSINGIGRRSLGESVDRREEEAGRKLRELFGIKENIPAAMMNSSYKLLEMLGLRENVSTEIEYKLAQESLVDVWILSLDNHKVRHLQSAKQPAGTHTVIWNGVNDDNVQMPRGYYIGQVFANKEKILQKGIRW
jgi:hypothetical protein